MFRHQLQTLISSAVHELGLPSTDALLARPADFNHGDWSSSVALSLANKHNLVAGEVAADIVRKILAQQSDFLAKVEVAGPGFINFFLTAKASASVIGEILTQGQAYGRNNLGQGQTVVVEFSSPNIAKPFSIGHLRSTIIGDAVAKLLQFSGWRVIRDNHLGDWGTQFGKLLVAIERWGNLSTIKTSSEPAKELLALYVRFHQEAETNPDLESAAQAKFALLEQGDTELRQQWQTCVELSLKEFAKVYHRLGVEFDTYHGESFYQAQLAEVRRQIEQSGYGQMSEGAFLFFFPQDELPPLMIAKRDGSSLYAWRDLAADYWRRQEYAPTLIINEAGMEQKLYFQQLLRAEELLGWFKPGQRIHLPHGLYRFPTGKMSTRRGEIVLLEEVLTEAVSRARDINPDEQVASAVGLGAIKYYDLKRESARDIVFDWQEVLDLRGSSGPYLQYTYARIKGVLGKAERLPEKFVWSEDLPSGQVEKYLQRFPETIERSASEYAPHHLANYLYELSSAFNAFYQENKIIGSQHESYYLALCQATAQVLAQGMDLLGLPILEQI